MNVRTQDRLTIIPCLSISGQYTEQYRAWDILCISPFTGKPIKRLGTYRDEKQFESIFAELQCWIDDRNRRHKTYYMPPDVAAIQQA